MKIGFLIHFRMNSAIWSIFLKKTDFTWTMGVTPHWSTSTWGYPSVLLHVPALPLIVWIVWVNLVVKTHETVKLWEFSASRRFNNRESCIFHSLIRTSRLFFVCSSFFSVRRSNCRAHHDRFHRFEALNDVRQCDLNLGLNGRRLQRRHLEREVKMDSNVIFALRT